MADLPFTIVSQANSRESEPLATHSKQEDHLTRTLTARLRMIAGSALLMLVAAGSAPTMAAAQDAPMGGMPQMSAPMTDMMEPAPAPAMTAMAPEGLPMGCSAVTPCLVSSRLNYGYEYEVGGPAIRTDYFDDEE